MFRLTPAIKHLITINIIMFVAPQILGIDLNNLLSYHFPLSDDFGFWQFFTSMFIHRSFDHLLFNMIALFFFGGALEELLKTNRFVFLYLSAGIGASFIKTIFYYFQFYDIQSTLIDANISSFEIQQILNLDTINTRSFLEKCEEILNNNNSLKQYKGIADDLIKLYSFKFYTSLGASGAVFGISAAFATYFPNEKIFTFPIPIPIKSSILVTCFVISDLILGTLSLPNDTVGRFAHVGGAIIGFIIAWYWKKNKKNYV